MASKNGKETLLVLCTKTATLGNSIALHILDYLGTAKTPIPGFEDLALHFLETGRVLVSVRAGLEEAARSQRQFPPEINHELRERLRHIATTFSVLDQMVNKYRDNERKQGFGKIGKSFRMMFADTELEKMKRSLVASQEALMLNALMFPSQSQEEHARAVVDVGYTALAAIVDPSSSERGGTSTRSSTPATMLSPDFRSHSGPERPGSIMSNPSAEHVRDNPTTSYAMNEGLMRLPTPSAPSNDLDQAHDLDDTFPQEAIRLKADPKAVSRWTPKRPTGSVSPASKSALLSAVRQGNHKMIERMLDIGVPADGEPDHNLLAEAITARDRDSVRLLLLFGADVNMKDRFGFTPLYTATKAGFIEAAEALLKYGANPNACAGPENNTPLAASFTEGGARFTRLYLKYGADSDLIMANGDTPFIQAMKTNVGVSAVELMLLYEVNPNHKNARGETALFAAINAGRPDLVIALLDHGADPNLPGPKHMLWPSLHQHKILEVLLEQGADISRAPGILELATSINSPEAVDTLLKHGADPNDKKDGIYTPLCSAIRDDREILVEVLLAAGADPNLSAQELPVFKCVTHHRSHLLPRLLAAGADPSNPKGILETAVSNHDHDSLLTLLKHGVNANDRGSSGHTALTAAIRKNNLEALDILLSHGADPGVRGQEWPITMAVKNPEILAKLLSHMPTSKINKGALEHAVVADQLDSVKLLLAKGVDVEEKNGGVFSPLTTSIREDRKAIFRFLLDEAGADPNSPGEHLPIIKAIRRHRAEDLSYIKHLLKKGADMNLMYRGWNAVLQTLENGETAIFRLLAESGTPDLTAIDENGRNVIEIMRERGMKEELEILAGQRSSTTEINKTLNQLRIFVREEGIPRT